MLPSRPRSFVEKQAGCADGFVLSIGRHVDAEAGSGVSFARGVVRCGVAVVGVPSFLSAFRSQSGGRANHLARGKGRSATNPRSSHLETETDSYGLIARMFHPARQEPCLNAKEKNHEEAQSSGVDSGYRTWSGRSSDGGAGGLLRVGGLLRFLFRMQEVADR